MYNFSLHFLCILLTLFIALQSEVKNSSPQKGRLKTGGDRIYNGRDANYEDHPWAAFLEVKKPDNDPGKVSICGGTIINGSRLMTAKHCLLTKDKKSKATGGKIFMGFARYGKATYNNGYRVDFYEGDIELHPDDEIDVAALQFTGDNTPFEYKPRIEFAKVPPKATYSFSDKFREVTVIGWGKMENGHNSDILQEVEVPTAGNDACSADGDFQFCAGGMIDGVPTDSCNGDSGSTVECKDGYNMMFCGIVSEGPTDCGRSAGTYVTVADPQVRWFVLGNPDERPDCDCRVVSSKWSTILCATVALVKAML